MAECKETTKRRKRSLPENPLKKYMKQDIPKLDFLENGLDNLTTMSSTLEKKMKMLRLLLNLGTQKQAKS